MHSTAAAGASSWPATRRTSGRWCTPERAQAFAAQQGAVTHRRHHVAVVERQRGDEVQQRAIGALAENLQLIGKSGRWGDLRHVGYSASGVKGASAASSALSLEVSAHAVPPVAVSAGPDAPAVRRVRTRSARLPAAVRPTPDASRCFPARRGRFQSWQFALYWLIVLVFRHNFLLRHHVNRGARAYPSGS